MLQQEVVIERVEIGSAAHLQALALRYEILRAPLSMPPGSEVHEREADIWHFVASRRDRVVGCVLLLPDSTTQTGRLLQMAVHTDLRGQGCGRQLVLALEAFAAEKGIKKVEMHAREVAIPFYEKLGYACDGPIFQEVGIPHRLMCRAL